MKKQNFQHYVGIDLSKNTFDVAILSVDSPKSPSSFQFENSVKGTKAFIRLMNNQGLDLSKTIVCLEHTGIYGHLVISRLVENQISLCVEMSLKIIRSSGVQRGKSDRLDAVRIAQYALKNVDDLELYTPSKRVLDQVRILLNFRNKLVQFKSDLNKYPKELQSFDPELLKTTKKMTKQTTRFIEKQIKVAEDQLHQLILADKELNQNIQLATSVPGIGKRTALYLACFTNMFTRYHTPKQLACYCGVAPFEHSSGTSINKRPRVHSMANKLLKKHLHMGALAAVRFDEELNAYYSRKVEEGKNKMRVLNNVRNKMIHRLCAVIKRQSPYIKKYA